MAFRLFRGTLQTKLPQLPQVRQFGNHSFATDAERIKHRRNWYIVSSLATIGTVCLCLEIAVIHPHHDERPPYRPYPHMRIRNKPFPWRDGNKNLFYNPVMNPIPGIGYTEDPPNHH